MTSPIPEETTQPVRSSGDGSQINASNQKASEDSLSDSSDGGSLLGNPKYEPAKEPTRDQDGKIICEHQKCLGLFFDQCEWR
jgi:hypothetical protein